MPKPVVVPLREAEACTCGCVEHDQCRQDTMTQAEARERERGFGRAIDAFSRGVALAQTAAFHTPVCDCTICTNVRDVKEAAMRLAYALSAHAYAAHTEIHHHRLMAESGVWMRWAQSLSITHQKGGG